MMTLIGDRAALQWTLGILAAIPMASALGEILRGPQGCARWFTRCGSDRRQFPALRQRVQVRRGRHDPAGARAHRAILGRLIRVVHHRGRRPGADRGLADNAGVRIPSSWGRSPSRPSERRSCSPGSGAFLQRRCEHMPSVLVTGAGRGIGLAITEHMSRRGWNVYATARSDAALQQPRPPAQCAPDRARHHRQVRDRSTSRSASR